MRRALSPIVTGCLALVWSIAVPIAAAAPSPAAPLDPPAASGLLRWGATMGGSQTLTQAQAVTDAQSVSLLVGLQGTFSPYTASMRAANPSLKLIVYMNGVFATGASGASYPESWYLHDATGNRVSSTQFSKNYLMDPTNSGWIQSRVSACSSAVAATGWDGCYLDMLGAGSLTPGYLTSVPINSATGAAWTYPQFVAATTNLASAVVAALPTDIIVGNGLGTGNQYFSSSWGPSSQLIGPLAAADAQGFVRGSSDAPTQFRSESQWKTDVDMLVDAGTRGKPVLVEAKVWNNNATQAQKDAIHAYALATFLLGTNGSSYWYWSDTGAETAVVEGSPFENVNIGTPLGTYDKVLGAYQRRYTGGLVVVNPTGSSVTVPLASGTWTTLEGGSVQGSITLAANTGEVLTASGPWGPVPAATTTTASNVTPTSATVAGTVNPDSQATTAYAEFGSGGILSQLSTGTAVGSGTGDVPVQFSLTGLTPGATYTFHIDATSSAGSVAGSDVTFTTPLPAPTVRTGGGTANGGGQVTLSGVVNPNGLATTYFVQYGATTSYGMSSSPASAGSGTAAVTEQTILTGLHTGGLHYRYVATNATGTSYGVDRTIRVK